MNDDLLSEDTDITNDTVITDEVVPTTLADALEDAGVEVVVA